MIRSGSMAQINAPGLASWNTMKRDMQFPANSHAMLFDLLYLPVAPFARKWRWKGMSQKHRTGVLFFPQKPLLDSSPPWTSTRLLAWQMFMEEEASHSTVASGIPSRAPIQERFLRKKQHADRVQSAVCSSHIKSCIGNNPHC